MWNLLQQRFQSALRYKLFALVLLPLLAAMLVTLGYTLYWFHGYAQGSLNVTLRDQLAVARQLLRQLQNDRQAELQQLADSTQFRALLARHDGSAIQRTLQRLRDAKGLAFLHLTGVAGNWLYEKVDAERTSKPSPLTDRAGRGFAGAAFEVFREEDLRRESPALSAQARVPLSNGSGYEDRGLVLRFVQPIADDQGHVTMTLDAGLLFNHNQGELYSLSDRVFSAASLAPGAKPMIALLLDDTRVAASGDNLRESTGTKLAPELRARLGEKGDFLTGREQLNGEPYVSAYATLYDVDGQPIGLMQVGMREDAFRAGYDRDIALLLLLFLVATAAAAWIAVRGSRSVFKPIETMAAVVRATQAGEDRRIGPIGTRDEVAELARQFDTMLDQLAARNREIQRAAAALEVKVAERTSELAQKNAELRETIALLEKTQQQLVLADKLSALGQMAAGIAHEINNPAAVILGNLEMLSAELGPAAEPVAREIELIASQVDRIRHIVTSLLQFARARPGETAISDVDLNQVVQDVLPLVAHALKAKSITLHTRLEATHTAAVDMFDIEQVLINLIVNASNACDRGGIIHVTTADAEDDGVALGVCDNGRGIAQDDLKRIFDPFFSTDPQRGAGLGLSVSYGLVQRYGGRIAVDSTVGIGTVFRVWFARRPPKSATKNSRKRKQQAEARYG